MTQASSYLLLIKLLVKYDTVENSLVLLSQVYFVKVIHLKEDIENFAKSVQC